MYGTLTYQLPDDPATRDPIQLELDAALTPRTTLVLIPGTLVCSLVNGAAYRDLALELMDIATRFPGLFRYVFTLHRKNQELVSNGNFSQNDLDQIRQ